MKMKKSYLVTLAAGATLTMASMNAAVLVSTDFTGVALGANGTTPPSSVISGITWTGDTHIGSIGNGSIAYANSTFSPTGGETGQPAGISGNSVLWPKINVETSGSWSASFQFSVSGNPADTINFQDISFQGYALSQAGAIQGNAKEVIATAWIYGSDGSTILGTGSLTKTINGSSSGGVAFSIALDNAAVAYAAQDFTLVVKGAPGVVSGGNTFAIDNLSVNGLYNAAIPEASTYTMLAGIVALGLVVVRRRRK